MKTIKPISTISYNTKPFLMGVLDRLVKNKIIEFWVFIHHEAEEDETKAHFHVYLEPSKSVDTIALREQFNEIDLANPKEKPLGVLPFNKSDFPNWYWYGIHDVAYLASKGESRKYHYGLEDMTTNEAEYLGYKVAESPRPCSEAVRAMEMFSMGLSDMQIAVALNGKISQLGHAVQGVGMLRDYTYRNGKANHEEIEEKNEDLEFIENSATELDDIIKHAYKKLPEGQGRSDIMRELFLLKRALKGYKK